MRLSFAPTQTTSALVVLGMHRSGTSSLAGTCTLLGGKPPLNLIAASTDNVRGFWESCYIRLLNDYILKLAGSDWQDWRGIDPNWNRSAQAESMRAHAELILMNEFGNAALPVVKDPRMCRLMPFWLSVFEHIDWTPRILLPLRSPFEVARSLQCRDGLDLRYGCLLWMRHMLEAEAETRNRQRAIIVWDAFLNDWREVMMRARGQIEMSWPRWSDSTAAQIDTFISTSLRHHHASDNDPCVSKAETEWIHEAYAGLVALAGDPHAEGPQRTLDAIRADFDKTAAAVGNALRDRERAIGRLRTQVNSNSQADCEDAAKRLADLKEGYDVMLADMESRIRKPILRTGLAI